MNKGHFMKKTSFSDRIVEHSTDDYQLFMLHGTAKEFITWQGSFQIVPDLANGDDTMQDLIIGLLDKGTRNRNLFEISDFLEQRGAQTRFSNRGIRIGFSGKCMKEDLKDVLLLQFEQLRESVFESEQLEHVRNRLIGSVQRSREQTASMAAGMLSRLLYVPGHPNFIPKPEEEIRWLQSLTRDQLVGYHRKRFLNGNLNMAITGDLNQDDAVHALEEGIEGWKQGADFKPIEVMQTGEAREQKMHMEGKMNTDVRLGHCIPIYRNDSAFYALMLGVHILGGNFSSRLMRIVRDEQGLTYGIRSALVGFSNHYSGHLRIQVTLSEENLEKGIEVTRGVVQRIVEEGCTQQELNTHKETLKGDFKVGLATTNGLVSSLLNGVEKGYGRHYLDIYPQKIADLQLIEVNEALRTFCKPAHFSETRAGHLT